MLLGLVSISGVMIDVAIIRTRFRKLERFLDERGRRLFAANEAMSLGRTRCCGLSR